MPADTNVDSKPSAGPEWHRIVIVTRAAVRSAPRLAEELDMRLFMLAATLVYGVLAAIAIVTGRDELGGQPGLMLSVALSGWLAPTLASWGVAEGLNLLSPRRVFHRQLSMPVRRLTLGGVVGVLGSVLGVLGMAGLDRTEFPDAAITGIAAALAILPMARVRRGACLHCGYSFEGATPGAKGVCVECGADLHTLSA